MNILLVDDDSCFTQSFRACWPDSRDEITMLSTARSAFHTIYSGNIERYDCLFIDVQLQDGSGLELMREARGQSDVPIIMISGHGSADTRADAIAAGADDYVMKPFSFRELMVRTARLVGRMSKTAPAPNPGFRIGEVECLHESLELKWKDRVLDLTALETRLLVAMHDKRGHDCPKVYIARHALFREHDPSDKTIDVYINRLRSKLSALHPPSAEKLKTIRGVGYRLIA
jgi:DNA-binding response OmpR family regulator